MFGNAKNFFAWSFLVMFAILLIIVGVQGSAGRVLAVALCPSKLDVTPAVFGPYGSGAINLSATQTAPLVYQ